MARDELPRQLGEDDELPDDFGSRSGDTLTFGSGSYIRAISAEEARRRFSRPRLGQLAMIGPDYLRGRDRRRGLREQ